MKPVVVAAMLGVSTLAFGKPPAEPAPVPFESVKAGHQKLARHSGSYAPLSLRWQSNDRIADALGVYPHPVVAGEVYLATAAGLMKSTDAGQTYTALPHAAADKIGRITALTFAPDNAAKLLIATADHGLYVTTDAGQSLKPLASKSTGLAADAVRNVYYAIDDAFHRTLLAVHGEDSPGVSRSTDGGKTWQVHFPDKHVYGIYFTTGTDGKEMMLDAAPADDPLARSLHFAPSINEPWQKLLDDVIVTGWARRPRSTTIYLATAGKGIFKLARQGGTIRTVGPADVTEWSSFGQTFGPTADQQLFFGYHSKKLGMVVMTSKQLDTAPADDDADPAPAPAAYRTLSDGLFTGPLVLEGAHIRADAGGTHFYAVINRGLYQSVQTPDGPAVLDVAVTPANILIDPGELKAADAALLADLQQLTRTHRIAEAAAKLRPQLAAQMDAVNDRKITVRATTRTLPTDPAAWVSVDLSRLGMPAASQLFDDGQHDDGAADDGVYGNRFTPDLIKLQPPQDDWRGNWPGPVRLTVSLATRSGALAGGVGAMTLYRQRESIPFADSRAPARRAGNVVGSNGRSRDYKQHFKILSVRGPGDWAVSIGRWRDTVDISAQAALVFYVRSSAATDMDIAVGLRDAPTYTRPTQTKPVPLIAGGFLPGKKITPQEQRVVIPVSRLMEDAGEFQAAVTSSLTVQGTADQPVDIILRDIKFVPVLEEESP